MASAQISAEFFILLGLGLIIAIAFEIASLSQLKEFRMEKEGAAVRDLALKLQKEILIAASVEDGYVRLFEIPKETDTYNYSIATANNTIIVQSKNGFYLVAIPYIVGNLSKGVNIINKTGGIIYVNSAKVSYFTEQSICQSAQDFGLCFGLDIIYGPGYQTSCCSEHSLCC